MKIQLAARERIAAFCDNESLFKGDVEGDERPIVESDKNVVSEFVGHMENFLFGLLNGDGKFYASDQLTMAPKSTLQAMIRGQVDIERIIHAAGWYGYDSLVDIDLKKYYRV